MKKLLCLLSASLLVLTSCSKDDTPSVSNAVLLKKTIETYSTYTETTEYTYSDTKLVKATISTNDPDSSNYYIEVTYSGNLIARMDYKEADGTLFESEIFEYDANNKLKNATLIEPLDDMGTKDSYVYNTDGSVAINFYTGNHTAQTELNGTGTISFLNSMVSEITKTYTSASTLSYTWDNNNSPIKNVLGFDKLPFFDGDAIANVHNMITENDSENGTTTNSYTYNSSNYPATSTKIHTGEDTRTTQYFYE